MGIFNSALVLFETVVKSPTVRAILSTVEPLLAKEEAADRLNPNCSASDARRKSAQILAARPSLLGFINGLIFGFVMGLDGPAAENRTCGRVMVSLFPKNVAGLDLISDALATLDATPEYRDGYGKGGKVALYFFGADYSADPDAPEAIRVSRNLNALGADIGIPASGDERTDLVGAMMWMYFTAQFSEYYSGRPTRWRGEIQR